MEGVRMKFETPEMNALLDQKLNTYALLDQELNTYFVRLFKLPERVVWHAMNGVS